MRRDYPSSSPLTKVCVIFADKSQAGKNGRKVSWIDGLVFDAHDEPTVPNLSGQELQNELLQRLMRIEAKQDEVLHKLESLDQNVQAMRPELAVAAEPVVSPQAAAPAQNVHFFFSDFFPMKDDEQKDLVEQKLLDLTFQNFVKTSLKQRIPPGSHFAKVTNDLMHATVGRVYASNFSRTGQKVGKRPFKELRLYTLIKQLLLDESNAIAVKGTEAEIDSRIGLWLKQRNNPSSR